PSASTAVIQRQEIALALVIATLLLLVVGSWLWRRPDPAQRTKSELQSALVQEEQSLTHTIELPAQSIEIQNLQRLGDNAMAQVAVKIPREEQTIQVDKLQRLGDSVMAQVTVKYPEEGKLRAYRETRFYERSAAEWQRIPPDPVLLGPQKTLTIANFTILY